MINHLISDNFAHRKNLFTRIDPRVKIFCLACAVLFILTSSNIILMLFLSYFLFVGLFFLGVPLRVILMRISVPLLVAGLVVCVSLFRYIDTGVFVCRHLGEEAVLCRFMECHAEVYIEWIKEGLLLITRVAGVVLSVIFLSMTTSMNKILAALHWFRVPRVFVEIALLIYRYIFLLLEDAVIIRDAQKVRMGHIGFMRGLSSTAQLAGAVVIRAYDRSVAACEAMETRGYSNKIHFDHCSGTLNRRDIYAVCAVLLVILALTMPGFFLLKYYFYKL